MDSEYEIPLIIFPISLHCTGVVINQSKSINLNFSRRESSVLTLMHLVTGDLMDAFNTSIGHIFGCGYFSSFKTMVMITVNFYQGLHNKSKIFVIGRIFRIIYTWKKF